MTGLDLLAPHAAAIALATCRIGGFVALSPFPGAELPSTLRVGLVAVLSIVVGLTVPSGRLAFDNFFVVTVASELAIGALVGFVLRLSLAAAGVSGGALSQATGLGIASVLDPNREGSDTAASRMVTLFAMAVALSVGAHRSALAYLLESFRALPIGTRIDPAAGALSLAGWAGDAIALGVRISMPLLAVTLLAQAVLAVVTRTAPALQLYNLGMTIMVATAFAVFLASATDATAALASDLASVPDRIDRLLTQVEVRP
jgi:flagellar biosynthetic protein FliR